MPRKPTHYATTHWYLEFRDANSCKFYNVMVTETGICVIRWGRIGTLGQSKVSVYQTHEEALDEGRKQVYAKKHKGYGQVYGDLIFSASTEAIDKARGGNVIPMWEESNLSIANGALEGQKDAVLRHYRDFLEQAKEIAAKAGDDPEVTITKLEELKRVWSEIQDLHGQAEAAIEIAEATVFGAVFT